MLMLNIVCLCSCLLVLHCWVCEGCDHCSVHQVHFLIFYIVFCIHGIVRCLIWYCICLITVANRAQSTMRSLKTPHVCWWYIFGSVRVMIIVQFTRINKLNVTTYCTYIKVLVTFWFCSSLQPFKKTKVYFRKWNSEKFAVIYNHSG